MSKDSSANYCQNKKERLQKNFVKDIKVFLKKKKKKKKQQEHCQQYKNLPEHEKQKLVEYRNKYYKMRKNTYYNYEKLLFQKVMKNMKMI